MRIYRIIQKGQKGQKGSIKYWLPEWTKGTRGIRPDIAKISNLMLLSEDQFLSTLNSMSDTDVEEMLGVRSMKDVITIDSSDIMWNNSRQGTFDQVMAEVEENGVEYYDTSIPLICDFKSDGTLELTDGHHRYLVATEFEYSSKVDTEVQFSSGSAKKFFIMMWSQINR